MLYIYNLRQANFYMMHGVPCREVGVNPNTGRAWCKFLKEDTLEVYQLWLENGR